MERAGKEWGGRGSPNYKLSQDSAFLSDTRVQYRPNQHLQPLRAKLGHEPLPTEGETELDKNISILHSIIIEFRVDANRILLMFRIQTKISQYKRNQKM